MLQWLFSATPQVKVETIDENGEIRTFWRNMKPKGESDLDSVDEDLKKTGKRYKSIKIWYP